MLSWGTPPPARTVLEHGDWSLVVEGDRLEQVSVSGVHVLRSIRCVVRDRDWRTFPVRDAALEVLDDSAHRLAARVSGMAELDEQRVSFSLELGLEHGLMRVALRAEALTPVLRARLGLIVLHPLAEVGTVMTVVHPEGDRSTATLGPTISPHQPAKNIAALQWNRAGLDVDLALYGDVFEMEDQRNWIDASFKTYSTPLSIPFPVQLAVGDVIEHALELRVRGTAESAVAESAVARPQLGADLGHIPAVFLGATTTPGAVAALPDELASLGVLVEVPFDSPSASAILERAAIEANGTALDVRLHGIDASNLSSLIARLAALANRGEVRVARIGITSDRGQVTTPEVWAALVEAIAASHQPAVELLAGARSHFTEVNRRHAELPAEAATLGFSLTPQMHDEATAQIVESLDVLPGLLADARRIAGDRALVLGPITLRSRYNTVASTAGPTPGDPAMTGYGAHLVPDATDARWQSPAAGVWLLGALQRLARPGVAAIAIGEVRGPRGVVRDEGTFTAAGEVVKWWAGHEEGVRVDIAHFPQGVHGLAVRMSGASESIDLLLGSLREEPVRVELRDHAGRIHEIDLQPGALAAVTL